MILPKECASCGMKPPTGYDYNPAIQDAEKEFGKPLTQWNYEPIMLCKSCYDTRFPLSKPHLIEYNRSRV